MLFNLYAALSSMLVVLPTATAVAVYPRGNSTNTTSTTLPRKVGLVWPNQENSHLHTFATNRTHYLYTWSPICPDAQVKAAGLNCARMLWGTSQLADFRKYRDTPGTTFLMGMNEVNHGLQSNLTPSQALSLWNSEIRPYGAKGYTLVSPSVTNAPDGITWFKSFFSLCGGTDKCGVDRLAIHYYGTSITDFQNLIIQMWNAFQIPIWVTEFACQDFSGKNNQCTKAQVWNMMMTMQDWMDKSPYVDQYFAFGAFHNLSNVNPLNQLMASDGNPTDLGWYYIQH